ncbi:homeobox-containing protein 1-like isoform X2 [Acipenser oxyrinchus oxyrinchus]|uniref:Homeobox-containing protein 1 n=1 Tax=Acipenser oxyrinchus oxyrinchus TaxID=40147 RepID=A0AAD8CU48_ACIOX|nr:homeobox-containing protein 1-like isoform X2 [Acipenser oxyrinchus oxyrinchus]
MHSPFSHSPSESRALVEFFLLRPWRSLPVTPQPHRCWYAVLCGRASLHHRADCPAAATASLRHVQTPDPARARLPGATGPGAETRASTATAPVLQEPWQHAATPHLFILLLLAPPLPSPSNETSRPQGQSFSYDLEEWDVEERVEEYMRRDSSVVKEEIKVFLNNRRISQAIVGQVTGISQSYISQWLLQQGLEMSDPKKRAFYRWYLLERSSPGATLSLRPLCGPVKEEPEWSGSPGGGVSLRLRRGSRFTWRKECLSVMESFFQENQYPEESKREEIAGACNAVIQKPAGSRLSEFEKVTALKVYNWFANRRKEMKRRANIEAAILESHGIDLHSPSCQSNSDDIEGAELHDTADLTSGNAPQQEPLSLAEQAVTLHSPVLRLANQKAGELKREAVEEE